MAESLNKKAQRAILKAIEAIANECEARPSGDRLQEQANAANSLAQAFSSIKGARDVFEKESDKSN